METCAQVKRRGQFKISPAKVRFTHDSVAMCFQTGLPINKACEEIAKGRMSVEEFPLIRVLHINGSYFSTDNRRLYVFRVLNVLGLLHQIPVTQENFALFDFEKFTTQNNGCHVFVRKRRNNNKLWMNAQTYRHCKCFEGKKRNLPEWWNEEFKCHVSLVHLKSRLLSPKPNLLRLSTPSSARNAKTRMLSSHDHNSTYIKKANVAWSERVKHGAGTAFEKNGASTVFYLSGATSRHLKNEKKNAVAFNTPSAEDVFPRAEYKKFDEVIISPVIDSWGAIVAVAEQPKASQTPRYSKTDPHSVVLSLPHRNNQQEEVKKMCKNSEREGISNTISQIYPVSQPIETQPMDLHVKVTKADEIDSISSDPVNIFFTKSNSVIAADKKEASFHAFKTKSNEPKTFELTFTKASDNTSNSKAAEENQTLDLLSESLSHQADKMLISDSNLFATSSKKPTVITQPLSLLQSNTSYKSSTTFISSKRKSKTDLQANLEEPSGDENRYCCQTCSCRFSSRVNLQVASKSASCCYACCLSRTKTQITSTGHSLSSCCFSSRSCSTTCGSAMPCCKPCETEFFSCYNSCCTYGKYSSSSLRSCWVDFSRLFVGSLRTFSHFIKCGCINVGGSNSPSSSARVPVANCSCYSCLSCCAPSRIDESVFPNNVTKKI